MKYTALREFRLTDRGQTLRSGEEFDFDDEYCKSSRSFKAAINAGWLDRSKKVSRDDTRLQVKPKIEKKKSALQPVIEDEDKQTRAVIDQTIATPTKKNAVPAHEAQKAAQERAAMRLKRLQDKETPSDDLEMKGNVLSDDIPASTINKRLEERRAKRQQAEIDYRKSKSLPKNEDVSSNEVSANDMTVIGNEQITEDPNDNVVAEDTSGNKLDVNATNPPSTLTVKQEMAKRKRDMRIKGLALKETK